MTSNLQPKMQLKKMVPVLLVNKETGTGKTGDFCPYTKQPNAFFLLESKPLRSWKRDCHAGLLT
ncbi:hypothetical protein ASE21_19320 [Flavobacterium sp. Root901]|uniref:hypothetical protein n=1 Tax=Flavobacterium sp. Root901 TaxID=1736605 RepID=UPI0007111F7E|nr:hypothetical protein [Flavobacterium sp. Root901]KRD06323.1 hypothetical protein ASE21_19320 [Flavobacterium sp. Root901]